MRICNLAAAVIAILMLLCTQFASGQSFKKFREGRYYEKNGAAVSGFVYYDYSYKKRIKFRKTKEAKKRRIKAKKLAGFTVDWDTLGIDSFIVLKRFKAEGANGWVLWPVRNDFVQVVATGKVTVYKHYSVHGIASTVSYYITKKGPEEAVIIRSGKRKFRKKMSAFLGDNPQVKKGILEGKYTFENLRDVIVKYNED